MARRTKLTAPSAEELKSLEDGFAAKPSMSASGMMPPIAQVAAEAASLTPTETTHMRAEAARDKRDAERLRQAEAEGLILLEIPTADIIADELSRDRLVMDPEAMGELKASISLNGLRLPLEVFEIVDPGDGPRYGLLSGFRRLAALRALEAETANAAYGRVKVILRHPGNVGAAFLAMVEENEIRADLTPYERGRVGVLSVQQGAFETVEQAVNGLFHAASKAKRSKIRSFALVHEELGDMLSFPEHLSERAGLRLASALRAGLAGRLREALATGQGVDPVEEWALLEPIVEIAEAETREPKRGGRPRRSAPEKRPDDGVGIYHLENGISIRRESDTKGYYIRLEGRQIDGELVDTVMFEIKRLLEPR
ncbi:ParB/RepB/Spo0J family partition protein [Meridianimarinicoccus aquatilis]|uniref:Chromosome partitioning protein ParB n=1 Tax=Meridianimarinicoccus aquatilis TaxID=2552766 RepID=A0A4R6AW99_9RHOB|nr:ParB N-terminal domain-containing protein [Fluviibacterium aquatile]QIE42997.1 ParB N-terminal domain-containing protein [Rhodobacteraceae bacterium SC52]TDL88981.1 chromosome partitioning protein ParB [Fluviibacterium aquatile]